MRTIELWDVIKIHDLSLRWRGKCDDCGKIRLRTQITLKHKVHKQIRVEWLCNECLTKTPDWL